MSASLVAVDESTEAQVGKLRSVARWVEDCSDPADAAEVADKASKARAYVKAMNGAAEIGREATRLECIAIRKLGQMGCADKAGTMRRGAALHFASLSDAEFEEWLNEVGPWSGAIGLYRLMGKRQRDAEDRDYGQSVGSGKGGSPVLADYSIHDLSEAAAALLGRYAGEDVPFSISEVADEMAGVYGGGSPAARAGYIEAVRLAIQEDNYESDDGPADMPAWITYLDGQLGWVRVPWRRASMAQFEGMVALREKQAADLARVSTALRTLYERMKAVSPDYAEMSLSELSEAAWRGGHSL